MIYGLDLFSGNGGLGLALEKWVRPILYCEREPHAQAVLLSRMRSGELPVAPIWDDVRTLKGSRIRNRVDIITAGVPCPDFSVAGTGEGLEGERGNLFFPTFRIIKEVRPAFVFFENVPAIRSRGANRICFELASMGYDMRFTTVSAGSLGAPHKRERWFLMAHTDRKLRRHGYDRESAILQDRIKKDETQREALSTSYRWPPEPELPRVANGIPAQLDRLRGLGNAVVPVQAKIAFERLMGL